MNLSAKDRHQEFPRESEVQDIRQVIHDWLSNSFDDPRIKFVRNNNPLDCYYDKKFICEVRVDLIAGTVSIWTPTGKGEFLDTQQIYGVNSYRFSCHPFKKWFLADPKSFDGLRDAIVELLRL